MVSLLSFNTKKRRTSKTRAGAGSGDKGVSRAGRKQEGEGTGTSACLRMS